MEKRKNNGTKTRACTLFPNIIETEEAKIFDACDRWTRATCAVIQNTAVETIEKSERAMWFFT